ncbi:hypothetical protein HXX76_012726 [Chlamydomonas incerta]|uniref:Uncharacterized protein n=1 Tax=Chlamydomonas incerta TaxID=51695 RepID=A0A835VVR4_CHLIN|nr:hypothetical protein HXX76_012726 [Chlamydomonas incerta]|eukprot:KAG2426941.1 hypothetical protein HXX76_012726 [Chlamydomonas incerta]
MQGLVLEVAMRSIYAGLGVRGASIVLQSLDDVLQFLLPGPVLYKAATDEEFFRAMRAEILGSLLDKDTGFLNAVIVLLKGEGMHQEAEEVQAILSSGMGIEAASDGLHAVRRCLQAVESHAKDKGLGDDIKAMYDYCRAGSPQERATRLEETLFVRCVAATLRGSYTGVLEVDAGAGIGCEVDEGTCTLRLRAGETKYSAAEMDAADVQLQALFLVMAFTLDKVLAAVAAAPAASKARAELVQLPRHFVMDGYCVYAGKATEQQLQRRKAANDRCTVAEHSAINKKGLEHALLQVHFANARFVKL